MITILKKYMAEIINKIISFVRNDRISGAAALILAGLVILALTGPYLPIGDSEKIGAGPRLSSPSLEFPLGTDELGRSYLPRLVDGLKVSLLLVTVAVLITAVIGVFLGMLSAYVGGFMDGLIVRIADIQFAFPIVLVGLLVTAIMGPGTTSVVGVIAFATLPMFVRLVRSVTIKVAGREFIIAAEVAGASLTRILCVHILPNIIGSSIVQLTYAISIGIIIEGVLSFLGIGVQPPEASLGSLVRQGSLYLTVAPWMVFASCSVLSLVILSINLLGDGLRDVIEPIREREIS